ncbi:MAG: transcription-repair coupling factor, partial [Prevotella sp.]|nr:transcription-repair coupling factor [Prevotella sp.]
MVIKDLLELYARSPQSAALVKYMEDDSIRHIFLQGLVASAPAVLFASAARRTSQVMLFILQDADEAGYFYHDLEQMLGNQQVFYFPSSYRRQIKYGQLDAASNILRTEVLSRLATVDNNPNGGSLYIVTHPEAVAELVVSKKNLDERSVRLKVGESLDSTLLQQTLREYGFMEVDYVYEPGQFAVRGSIMDVYSYSHEYPFRIDFFGDEIDSIRTFEVDSQLSRDKKESVEIVPELTTSSEKISFFRFLPSRTLLAMKDVVYVKGVIDRTYR